ncbi:MAG: hypothetical protein AAGA17_14325 [Actinomycetota bacterium]
MAMLGPPPPAGVVFGAGARPGLVAPDVEELRWSDDDLDDLTRSPIDPG